MATDTEAKVESPKPDLQLVEDAEAILATEDAKFETVQVPEWNCAVRIRSMTGEERDAFESSIAGDGKKLNTQNIRAKLVMLTVVNAKGERVFNREQIERLGKKSAAALNRVYEASAKLSAITKADVEELAKNSGKDQREDSSLV
jgi:hypothetical protein